MANEKVDKRKVFMVSAPAWWVDAESASSLYSSRRTDRDSHQLQVLCPAKKPAFFVGNYVGLGDGVKMTQLGKVAVSTATSRAHNVSQVDTRFSARSLES
jgi:hypothetical protein